MTLDEAKAQVRIMLDMADGDAGAVLRAIDLSRRTDRQRDGATADRCCDYDMLKLAWSDLTA